MSVQDDSWKIQAVAMKKTGLFSNRGIARMLGVARSTCQDLLQAYEGFVEDGSSYSMDMVDNMGMVEDNSRILVLSDIHAPYHHPNTLDFIDMLQRRYEFTRIISVGDEQDISASSFHDYDPDLMSAGHELKATQLFMKELEARFPVMDIMSSNHGDLFYRKAKSHGIPLHVIKSYNDVLGVGEGWKWHNDLVITLPTGEDVYFCHGKAQNGLKLSQNMGMNCVQGHYHNSFNIQYWSSPRQLYWSMQVGCLIDDKSLAMSYNKLTVHRPIIGCGVIIDGIPQLEAMSL